MTRPTTDKRTTAPASLPKDRGKAIEVGESKMFLIDALILVAGVLLVLGIA